MIKEIRDFKLKQLERKLEEYKQVKEKINEKKQQIAQLENELQEKRQLIPYKKFNWIQKHITQRKEYKNYKKVNEESLESEELLEKEIELLRREKEELLYKSGKIDHIQLELQIEEIRKSKNIRTIRVKF